MRWICGFVWMVSLHAADPYISVGHHHLRRCSSDSEIDGRHHEVCRHFSIERHQAPQHARAPIEIYAPHYSEQQSAPGWCACTPAQATVKAAYIGCFATIIAGLGASLIGVLVSGST